MSKDSLGEKAAGCGLILVGLGVLMFLGSVVRGLVLTKLWAWFIVPTFNLAALSVGQAIGLCLVVCFIRPVDLSDVQKKEDYSLVTNIFSDLVITPIVTLLFAKAVHAFLM